MRFLSFMGLVAMTIWAGACASSSLEPWPTAADAEELSMPRVIDQVNRVRAHYSLRPLTYNAKLTTAARKQARYQAAVRQMSHYGYRGARLEERLVTANYHYHIAGENVSRGRQTERDVILAWMNSRTHRDMILNPNISEIGVAAAVDERGQIYWSMVMAHPLSERQAAGPRRQRRIVFW